METYISSINFQSKIKPAITKITANKSEKIVNSALAIKDLMINKTHFYTPRRSAEAVEQDIERLCLVLKKAVANNEILSRKELAYRAGITPHQLNNMINQGKIKPEIMTLYEMVKIKNPEKFKPLPETVTNERINAIRNCIKALWSKGAKITGETVAQETGISVHEVRRILANDTAGLNTLKKSLK